MIDFYFVSDEGGEGEKFKQSGLLSLGFLQTKKGTSDVNKIIHTEEKYKSKYGNTKNNLR